MAFLGNYDQFPANLNNSEAALEADVERKMAVLRRFSMQSEARAILRPGRPESNIHHCLRKVIPLQPHVKLLHAPQYQSANYRNLVRCGQVWICSCCAAVICSGRRGELERLVSTLTGLCGRCYMQTLTFSHRRDEDVRIALQRFQNARDSMQSCRAYKDARKAMGVIGSVTVLEVTWSPRNGFHPHAHELLFCLGEQTISDARYEAVAREQWRRAGERNELTMSERGYKLDKTWGAIADYIAKYGHEPASGFAWGVEDEITRGHLKLGRGDVKHSHVTPFQLLRMLSEGHTHLVDYGKTYDLAAVWLEFAEAFKGRQQLHGLGPLKKLLLPDEEVKTDLQLVEESIETAYLLGLIERRDWKKVLSNDIRGELLVVARTGDISVIAHFLAEFNVKFYPSVEALALIEGGPRLDRLVELE